MIAGINQSYKVVDNEACKELHNIYTRHAALMWAARWCDDHGYGKIEIIDEDATILLSRGQYNESRR